MGFKAREGETHIRTLTETAENGFVVFQIVTGVNGYKKRVYVAKTSTEAAQLCERLQNFDNFPYV